MFLDKISKKLTQKFTEPPRMPRLTKFSPKPRINPSSQKSPDRHPTDNVGFRSVIGEHSWLSVGCRVKNSAPMRTLVSTVAAMQSRPKKHISFRIKIFHSSNSGQHASEFNITRSPMYYARKKKLSYDWRHYCLQYLCTLQVCNPYTRACSMIWQAYVRRKLFKNTQYQFNYIFIVESNLWLRSKLMI